MNTVDVVSLLLFYVMCNCNKQDHKSCFVKMKFIYIKVCNVFNEGKQMKQIVKFIPLLRLR